MKRFWKAVTVEQIEGGWQVALDGRRVRTQGGREQLVPSPALAHALADEWRAQGEQVDPRSLPLRDLADHAIDHVAPDPAPVIAKLLRYADTDTLCYFADPDAHLFPHQKAMWEPLLGAVEARESVRFERISGVGYRAQPEATVERLRTRLEQLDPFTLAALEILASLAASLCLALEALDGEHGAEALFAAANLEEDWQAQQWGWDEDARACRDERFADFTRALALLDCVKAD